MRCEPTLLCCGCCPCQRQGQADLSQVSLASAATSWHRARLSVNSVSMATIADCVGFLRKIQTVRLQGGGGGGGVQPGLQQDGDNNSCITCVFLMFISEEEERNVLFNDTLNTLYFMDI